MLPPCTIFPQLSENTKKNDQAPAAHHIRRGKQIHQVPVICTTRAAQQRSGPLPAPTELTKAQQLHSSGPTKPNPRYRSSAKKLYTFYPTGLARPGSITPSPEHMTALAVITHFIRRTSTCSTRPRPCKPRTPRSGRGGPCRGSESRTGRRRVACPQARESPCTP